MADSSPREHELEAYEAAVARARLLQTEWVRLGRPTLLTGPRGGLSMHPLLKAIAQAERAALQLRRRVLRKGPGRPPEAIFRLRR